jgi:hypothetical protein
VLPVPKNSKNVEAIRLEEKIPIKISDKTHWAPEERFKSRNKDFFVNFFALKIRLKRNWGMMKRGI